MLWRGDRSSDGETAKRRHAGTVSDKSANRTKIRKRGWEVGKEGRRTKEEMEDNEKVKGNNKG